MNRTKRNWIWTGLMTAVFAIAMVGTAAAHGGGRGSGPSRSRGAAPVRPGHPVGLLKELIFPCQAACSDGAESCVETADATALSCVSAACAAEVTAAQTACTDDDKTTECRTAVSALRECADACLDSRATAVGTCRTDLRTCVEACESDQ